LKGLFSAVFWGEISTNQELGKFSILIFGRKMGVSEAISNLQGVIFGRKMRFSRSEIGGFGGLVCRYWVK